MRSIIPFALLHFLCAASAFCGAPFTCMKAGISNNGSFLVLSEVPSEAGVEEPGRIALRIYPREKFINAKDQLSAPATYWTDRLSWSVILDLRNLRSEPACPIPLITDDGEFLILLQIGPIAAFGGTAVQIYRRRDHIGDLMGIGPDHGVFIKSISLKELWLPGGPDAIPGSGTDESPQWFAGGSFDFSPDNRRLTYNTPKGGTVHIDLTDGAVRKGE